MDAGGTIVSQLAVMSTTVVVVLYKATCTVELTVDVSLVEDRDDAYIKHAFPSKSVKRFDGHS